MTTEWNKEQELHAAIAPLVAALVAACEAQGMPVAVAVQYNERKESSGLHISYNVTNAEPGGFMSWIAACLEAASNNAPIPLPVPAPSLVGMVLSSEDDYISLLKSLGATRPADLDAALANASAAGLVAKVSD